MNGLENSPVDNRFAQPKKKTNIWSDSKPDPALFAITAVDPPTILPDESYILRSNFDISNPIACTSSLGAII